MEVCLEDRERRLLMLAGDGFLNRCEASRPPTQSGHTGTSASTEKKGGVLGNFVVQIRYIIALSDIYEV